ncbi:TrkH family potassium uptake protein [Brevibacillus humidisoli]|uniref:TrkH family potassium uptake protein n=1 Tax=Brevibacillus humidisoli TaxID=2895522 RepID=UPI001E3C1D45|nr:TrkH family potassium uptake protein [Brevibacillus humidisoli]UFJ39198.1 TrkH family potassium uptake protein [Brevibacillus humidisoli]
MARKPGKHQKVNPPQVLLLGFLSIILIGTALLRLPLATVDGQPISWIDALFTATSAVCVTGLVVVDTGSTFSTFGQIVILTLIQIGGIGFMTFATFFAFLLGRRISLKDRLVLQQALNQNSIEGIVRLVLQILIFTVVIELVAGAILAARFAIDMPLGQAIYYGIFHSIANFNNAGFDLMGDFNSFTRYPEDPIISLVIGSLIFIGGIGFLVMSELYEYRHTRRLSLHTKVVLATTSILTLVGMGIILLIEWNNPRSLQPLSVMGKFLASLFQSITPRSGGATTLNVADFQQATIFLTIVLMFIGASPGSAGGGIKVTTFATLIGAVWSQIKGREDVVFFRQRISPVFIYKSLTVTLSGLFFLIVVSTILSLTEGDVPFIVILFETTSAFATVGLSLGLTPDLSPVGRVIIAVTMFIGRIGPLTIAIALAQRRQKEYYRYPKGKILIG